MTCKHFLFGSITPVSAPVSAQGSRLSSVLMFVPDFVHDLSQFRLIRRRSSYMHGRRLAPPVREQKSSDDYFCTIWSVLIVVDAQKCFEHLRSSSAHHGVEPLAFSALQIWNWKAFWHLCNAPLSFIFLT